MKNELRFTLCSRLTAVDLIPITKALDAIEWPMVVFPSELFTASEMRKPELLHGAMEKLGYAAVAPIDGKRWRWHAAGTEFSARWAYVRDGFLGLHALRPTVVAEAINERGERRPTPRKSVGGKRESVGFEESRSAAGAGGAA